MPSRLGVEGADAAGEFMAARCCELYVLFYDAGCGGGELELNRAVTRNFCGARWSISLIGKRISLGMFKDH